MARADMPQVTAIMPVFNGLPHCRASLRSIVSQTQPPTQLIVVDDGSTDGSADQLRQEWEQIDSAQRAATDFLVLQQVNAGQSAARNAAVHRAKGALLAFIDQDDLWAATHLEVLSHPFADDVELGWSYSDFDEIDGDGMMVAQGFIAHHGLQHPKRSLTEILGGDLMVLPSASVISREAFLSVGGFDERLCGYEDDDLFLRMFRRGWRSIFCPAPLTKFRVHSTSASASSRFQASRVQFLDNVIETVGDSPRFNRYWARDLVHPRLFQVTITEYCTALRCGEIDVARQLADTTFEISARFDSGGRRRHAELWLMRRPRLMRHLLRWYERLPVRWRPRINPGLSLRVPGSRPGG